MAPELNTARNAAFELSAANVKLITLTKRSDFLAAARALRSGQTGLVLQARERRDENASIRVGFTCSKKVGNAVTRNRAKRRLREVAHDIIPLHGRTGFDYVLIGRAQSTVSRDFTELRQDLLRALKTIHGPKAG
ncbi:MAG: ribonuclease P protein component [Pseudomonadota bacterium]